MPWKPIKCPSFSSLTFGAKCFVTQRGNGKYLVEYEFIARNRGLKHLLLFLAGMSLVTARSVISFDEDWSFLQEDRPGAQEVEFDASDWRVLDVPHDWSIEGSFREDATTGGAGGWLPSGVGWYRKSFKFSPDWKGKKVWVEFDGVMANSEVWLNGHSLGVRPSGYFSFRHDLTEHLVEESENVLAVRADNSGQPASRWYTGAGIYRHVRLVAANPLHLSPDGVVVTTPQVSSEVASVLVTCELLGVGEEEVSLFHQVFAPNGEMVASVSQGSGEEKAELTIPSPALWSVTRPQLYRLVTQVKVGEVVHDSVATAFGIREAEFRADTGFWLNGVNLKIKGVCLHHDGGGVGAAVPLRVWERRLETLKKLGVNGIRTAHNAVDPGFLDLCDRMGFLVMNEAFDCWEKGKNPHDYHRVFKEWAHRDLRDMIRRDRNHPSVILYSVGNEIRDTHDSEHAKAILKGLIEVCHQHDPTRPVTMALFRPNTTGDYDNGLSDLLDVVGTNYRDLELLEAWKEKPSRKIIGTEQGHERGTWFNCRDHPQHAGQFLWVGIDYLGEARTWPVTTFNAGLLDRTGYVHPRGAERQTWWSEEPVVHVFRRVAATEETPSDPGYEVVEWKRRQVLFPDWTPRDKDRVEQNVEIYTNAAEVELFLNGDSLGTKKVRKDFAVNWKVPFETGTLLAIARIDGQEVARQELKTAGEAARLELAADRARISNNFEDVSHIEVRVVDAEGVTVPRASYKVKYSISGPGRLLALDSGSITNHERFKDTERTTFQGRSLAIVQAKKDEGEIVLRVESEGLEPTSVTLTIGQ